MELRSGNESSSAGHSSVCKAGSQRRINEDRADSASVACRTHDAHES